MLIGKLFGRTNSGAIQQWEIFVDGNSYWSESGQLDGKITASKPKFAEGKNIGKINETTPEEQAILEAQSKFKHKQKSGYTTEFTKVDEAKNAFVKVMLASTYEKRKDKMTFDGCLISPKLDGLRFVATKDHSHSRGGKQLGGMNLIRKQMDKLFEEHPEINTDGEGYTHLHKDKFNEIVSLIKRDESKISDEKKKEILDILEYHIYDVLAVGNLTASDPYIERFEMFWNLIDSDYPELKRWLKKVKYEHVVSHEDIQTKFEQHIADGYEGSIIRYDRGYENKRSNYLIKVKIFDDDEFEIIEILEGRGNRSEMAGKIRVKDMNGVIFKSGIRGGEKFYKELWKQKTSLIGKTATIRYFGKNPDTDVPRFPVCVRVDRASVE